VDQDRRVDDGPYYPVDGEEHGDKLFKKVLRAADDPAAPRCQVNWKVRVHCVTWVAEDGSLIEDTERSFMIDNGNVILGLNEAVKTMCIGECARFRVHYSYAYRELGIPELVPPKAEVKLEIDVLDAILPPPPVKTKLIPNDEKLQTALEQKKIGNEKFAQGSFVQALTAYNKGLHMFAGSAGLTDSPEGLELKITLHLNASAALLKSQKPDFLKEMERVKSHCSEVLKHDESNVKALYRRALARQQLKEITDALDDISKALKMSPTDPEIRKTYQELSQTLRTIKANNSVNT